MRPATVDHSMLLCARAHGHLIDKSAAGLQMIAYRFTEARSQRVAAATTSGTENKTT